MFQKSKKSTTQYRTNQPYTMRDIWTDAPQAGREHIEIQTDQFVEEFTDKAPHYEFGVDQGDDFKIIEPPPVYLMPVKKGKDFCA